MILPSEKIVIFYLGQGTDQSNRTIYDIHSWDYDKLEYTHDYIQWLFPLTERSQCNPYAPVLNSTQIKHGAVLDN